MSLVEPVTAAGGGRRPYRRSLFGIEIESLLELPGAQIDGTDTRVATLEPTSTRQLERSWAPRAATRALERRTRDGRLVMAVDHDPDSGYFVQAPRNGRHLVSPDGTRIASAVPDIAAWRWQRLLFAQVLPLAATLQGLELIHASAVVLEGRAVGFVAPAGTGKTSVAAHVVASGGTLLTDDVLALERIDGRLLAHPGPATLSIDSAELESMSSVGRARVGTPLGQSDKRVLSTSVSRGSAPLERLYFLERPVGGRVRIEPRSPDPVFLLASSFNTYVRTPVRIVNQLAVAARLAESVALFSVCVPAGVPASDVARDLVQHAVVT
jgi:hypothetical protein